MTEDRGIPRIEDVADALERDEHTLRIERLGTGGYVISDDTFPVALQCGDPMCLYRVVLSKEVIDAIKERC